MRRLGAGRHLVIAEQEHDARGTTTIASMRRASHWCLIKKSAEHDIGRIKHFD